MTMLDQHKTSETLIKSHLQSVCTYITRETQFCVGSRGHDQSMFELDGGDDHTLLSTIKERW